MRIPYGTIALVGATLLVGVVVVSYILPSDDYLYVPNEAQPVADNVTIEGRKDPSDAAGGIYTIDVTVRKARWAERYVPFLRPDGASLVPGHAVTARGESFAERRAKSLAEMARSEEIASRRSRCARAASTSPRRRAAHSSPRSPRTCRPNVSSRRAT